MRNVLKKIIFTSVFALTIPLVSCGFEDPVEPVRFEVDTTSVVFNDLYYEYDGDAHVSYATFNEEVLIASNIEGVTALNYTYTKDGANIIGLPTQAGVYDVTLSFEVNWKRYIAPEDMYAKLYIQKTIDMSPISFNDQVFQADGTEKSIALSGLSETFDNQLYSDIIDVTYSGNGESTEGAHAVTANITVKDSAYKLPEGISRYTANMYIYDNPNRLSAYILPVNSAGLTSPITLGNFTLNRGVQISSEDGKTAIDGTVIASRNGVKISANNTISVVSTGDKKLVLYVQRGSTTSSDPQFVNLLQGGVGTPATVQVLDSYEGVNFPVHKIEIPMREADTYLLSSVRTVKIFSAVIEDLTAETIYEQNFNSLTSFADDSILERNLNNGTGSEADFELLNNQAVVHGGNNSSLRVNFGAQSEGEINISFDISLSTLAASFAYYDVRNSSGRVFGAFQEYQNIFGNRFITSDGTMDQETYKNSKVIMEANTTYTYNITVLFDGNGNATVTILVSDGTNEYNLTTNGTSTSVVIPCTNISSLAFGTTGTGNRNTTVDNIIVTKK